MTIDRERYLDASEVKQSRTVIEAHCILDFKMGRRARQTESLVR